MTEQIENGLYRLDDTIESLLSDHPDYELIDIANVNTDVTVEQLLTMTSGIADWSKPEDLMDRGTNGTPGFESKGGRQKLHLGPPYKTNMSSPGPGLWLERPKSCGTFIRKPVVEKICVVR